MTVSGMNSSTASTLFSGLSGGGNSLYSSFSELNSIRNGAYGKLLNSYYSEMGVTSSKKAATSGTDNTSRGYYERYLKEKELKAEKEKEKDGSGTSTSAIDSNAKVASNSNQMVSSIDKLANADTYKTDSTGAYKTDSILKEVKSYVDAYNSVLEGSKKTEVSGVSSNVSSMNNVTQSYAKKLSEIGITIGSDKKLSINEDTFKNADMNKVKEAFGKGGYGYSVRTNAYMANYYATSAQNKSNTYGSGGKTNLSDLMSSYSNYI